MGNASIFNNYRDDLRALQRSVKWLKVIVLYNLIFRLFQCDVCVQPYWPVRARSTYTLFMVRSLTFIYLYFFFLLHFFSLLFAWPTFYGFVFIFEQQSSKLEIYHKKLKTKKTQRNHCTDFSATKNINATKKNQINLSLSIYVAQIIQINATTKNFVYHAISIIWLWRSAFA